MKMFISCDVNFIPLKKKKTLGDFPGVTVGSSPLGNTGDMDSIPGLGGFHLLWSTKARVPQRLSQHPRAHEPQPLSPWAYSLCSATGGATAVRSRCIPLFTTRENPHVAVTKKKKLIRKKHPLVRHVPITESDTRSKYIALGFPGGPVVRSWHFHCQGPKFNPWSGK